MGPWVRPDPKPSHKIKTRDVMDDASIRLLREVDLASTILKADFSRNKLLDMMHEMRGDFTFGCQK